MPEFDPETFAEEKYVEYFAQLQQAYKRAFETMNDEFDSQLVHAIDQQVLNESEPFYEGSEASGEFRVELPENPHDRLTGVLVDEEKLDAVLERYAEEIRRELRREFDLPEQND